MMTDDEFARWAEVKPEAVCGGSDAQAINVFRGALFFIARCRVAIAAERGACARLSEEARALREAMEEIEAFIVIDHNIDPYQAIAVFAKRCARDALARAKGETK